MTETPGLIPPEVCHTKVRYSTEDGSTALQVEFLCKASLHMLAKITYVPKLQFLPRKKDTLS